MISKAPWGVPGTSQGPPGTLLELPGAPRTPKPPPETHQVRPGTPKDPQGPREDHQGHQNGGTLHPAHKDSRLQAFVASAEWRSAYNQ